MRIRSGFAGCVAVIVLLVSPSAAPAAVPFKDISSTGPLEHIYLGNELSCQVDLVGDTNLSFFPPDTIPGDCGTMLHTGAVTYSPDWDNHDGTATSGSAADGTPFTPVSQTDVTGTGTSGDPFSVTTVVQVGATPLSITRTDTYVTGNRFYRSDVQVSNSSDTPVDAVLYHAGDCFLEESDDGFGFFNAATSGIFCSLNPNNSPPGRLIGFEPLDAGSNYLEDQFFTVWEAIDGNPLANTVRPNDFIDNGAGLSWNVTVPALGAVTRSLNTVVDVTGGAQRPPAPQPPAAQPQAPAPAPTGTCRGRRATHSGTPGSEKIRGTKGRDVIVAHGGKDVLLGRGGKDFLCGGNGRDRVVGGAGKDVLIGGGGPDLILGGKGNDKMRGGTPGAPPRKAVDTCRGQGGKDKRRNCEKGVG
ncbi:MAG: calcium-binding protein [Solirubrobacterales bacterium]